MLNNEDDIKYSKLIKDLKQLKKVNAPEYFEANLMRKINSQDYKEKQPLSFWEKILIPSRFVPSASMAVAAVILLFFVNTGSDDLQNPLLADPRVREDVISGNSGKMRSDVTIEKDEQIKKEKLPFTSDTNEINKPENDNSRIQTGAMFTGSKINKEGLNFRKINLSPEERKQLKKLKEKIIEFLNSDY